MSDNVKAGPVEPVVINFGKNLRRWRKASFITQDELARRAGITASWVSHYECGRRIPNLEHFARLCKALEGRSFIAGYIANSLLFS